MNASETLEELFLSLDWNTDNGTTRAMYEPPLDFGMDDDNDDGFGLVPDCGDKFSFGDEEGPDVPSSLDQLCDWLDIAGEEGSNPVSGKLPDYTTTPHDIQPFTTFSTHDRWPI